GTFTGRHGRSEALLPHEGSDLGLKPRSGGLSSAVVDELPMFVGSSDIAAALGVTRQAVDHRMRTDPRAPAPVAVVNRTATWGGTRVWRRTDIDRWLGGVDPDRWTTQPGSTR
ncbi:helix-turn-helix transcriptional regulator, partial [Frankia sp. Cr1]|uniref:helix-turn-helix transcriptional regulator n=1 Tax=Frankia sp. Cr1 TaxID=3073931 RepID=UPI003A0FD475